MLVGQSFGAMVACEGAALRPSRVRRLALIDPIGLWRDDAPVTNWMLVAPQDLPGYVFREPEGVAAKALFSIPEDPEDGALARTRLTWAMGCTGKFIWPIPDKGLKKRIHRIEAPTLLVWGQEDRLVPLAYAQEFARRLAKTRLEVVKGAGHAPHLEQPETTSIGNLDSASCSSIPMCAQPQAAPPPKARPTCKFKIERAIESTVRTNCAVARLPARWASSDSAASQTSCWFPLRVMVRG